MKKLLVLLSATLVFAFICLFVAGCDTLKLAIQTTAPDGNKLLATTDVNLFEHEGEAFLTALGVKAGAKDSLFAISISSNMKSEKSLFKEGNRLTFSLADGSEIVLKNMLNSYYEVENNLVLKSTPVHGIAYGYYYTPWVGLVSAIPYEVAGYVPRPTLEKNTASYALYLISNTQLHSLMEKGVTALELESNERKFTMEKPEAAAGLYSQLYGFLLEKLKH